MPIHPDAELLKKLKDPLTANEGFRMLIQAYQEKIYWQARRMVVAHDDADDIVQNVFLKIFQHIDSFRGDSSLYTWIFRITANEVLSHLKSLQRRSFIPFDTVSARLEQKMVSDDFFSGDTIQLKLQKAILALPEKQRLVFTLKYYDEDMTFENLSAILDTSVGALKASYHHAVKKIEKSILQD